ALDADAHQRAQRRDVLQRGHPAGGDDRGVGALAHLAQQVEVRAAQGAVLGDVGDDVAGAAVGVQPGEHLPQVPALPGPAAGGQRRAADVEPDGDAVTVLGDDPGGPLRVLQRGGAEVHPLGAGVQRPGQALVVADAAGQLDGDVEVGDDVREQLGVRAAAEGGVEVDEVDPL